MVETVRGPVDVDALGVTLMHEHVFVLTPDVMQNYGDEWWDEEERVADAIAKLRALTALGVDTIVDPTVVGLGRYIPRIQRINAEVDLNIVVATGLYTFDEIPQFFHYRGPGTVLGGPELLTEMFLRDIREVSALCAQGYADRIVLSQDAHCYIDFFSGEAGEAAKVATLPNWHYEHIHRDVLPALRASGVTDEQIRTMLVENPRRYFASRA